jgi:sugar lactone lactonase YvrE
MGQFVRPKGIACDKEDNLYVVDAGFENVQIFNSNNQLLMFFGGPYKGPGDMWLPARVIIDYDNIKYFTKYVDSKYDLNYLIIVSNQYGPDKINVYGGVSLKK